VNEIIIWVFALGIGFVAGLRAFLAPVAVAFATHVGWLNLQGTPLSFMGWTVCFALFAVLAIGELIGDKLPRTPKRTALAPLLVRMLTGGLSGACLLASARHSLGIGATLGVIGALIGAFAGYEIRKRLVTRLKAPDFVIALIEDVAAISLAVFVVSR
jgi:uncharacterized membrane protein